MVRGKDACWEHCVLVDATRQKVRCNYCQREFSGGVYRMKFHLAQIKNKDIVPCTKVPNDVRDFIKSILSTPKKPKTTKRQKIETPHSPCNSSSASGDFHPNANSSGQRGSSCPSLLFPRPSPNAQLTLDNDQKQKHAEADKKIGLFFFHNAIPFCASKSIYYQEMVDAIAECGTGYKAPTYERIRTALLDKVKLEITDKYTKFRDDWKACGCTVISDCWTDGKAQSLIVFSVAYPKGVVFLKCVDASSHADDAQYLFELLESVVLEVGVEHVVQVITDSAESYVYAGRLLTTRYPSLFWSPCASYCIDKMLEDISKQEWVSAVIQEARIITRYIHSHSWVLSLMRKLTGGKDLVRPRISRFASNFLSLRAMVVHEDSLKHMFSHPDWMASIYSRRPDVQDVKSLLYLERFWKAAHEAINLVEPLMKLLRVVDGDMPAMGYIYEGIERAKLSIKAYYKGIEEKYVPIWEIIDRRWRMHQHSPLYAAAAFLNPSIFYNVNFKIDPKIRNHFNEAMMKMVSDDRDKMELTKEIPVYVNSLGALGNDFAKLGRTLNAPGDWWASYGYEIPILQRAAMRILSQPCSSYWCSWNWNIFDGAQTKKRSRLEQEKFNDLVFVHCNLRLQVICHNKNEKCKPVVFDEIDVSSVWPSESESSSLVLDDSWLDDLPFECKGSPSAYD